MVSKVHNMHKHEHTHRYICMHNRMHACINIYHTHSHAHTHTHTQTSKHATCTTPTYSNTKTTCLLVCSQCSLRYFEGYHCRHVVWAIPQESGHDQHERKCTVVYSVWRYVRIYSSMYVYYTGPRPFLDFFLRFILPCHTGGWFSNRTVE